MKKVLLFGIFLFFQFGFSQTNLNANDALLKGVKLEKFPDSKLNYIDNAKISWDFSNVDITNKKVSIEVVTIYDCFNGINATDFKETINVLSDENFSVSGSRDLIHLDLLAKCFKWRVLSYENGETKISQWSYFSFLK